MKFDYSYADYAFKNGKVITVNEKDEIVEAVAVKGNKIVYTGTDEGLEKIIDQGTKVIDLKGRTLMPGIIDSHYHPILNGLLEAKIDAAMIDTRNRRSVSEILDIIRQAVKLKKPGQWISMMGYEPLLLKEKRPPSLEELDSAAPDNPVHCMHVGGHICMYNSKALAYLNVYKPEDAKKYPDGEVEVADGKLTGLVRGHTHFWLWGQVDYTEEAQIRAAMISHKQLLEAGITSIHDCGECGPSSYHTMQKLCRNKIFRVRSYMMLHSIFGKPYSLEQNAHWMDLGLMSGLGDEHFKIGTCKFMIDGGSGAPSCATREPYSHDPELKGERGWEREEVAEYIKKINDAECQASAHAIGDMAVEFMVEGYEKAFKTNPRPDLRHRIEHCTLTDQDLIDRMAKMNICPSVNAGLVAAFGANYEKFYGKKRMKYFGALRSMLDAGITCSLHSDAPSGPYGLKAIDGAVNRYDRNKNVQCDRTQSVSVPEAIRCSTYNAAYASFEEKIKGSIEVGKLADMIILSRDILSIDPMDIYNLDVDMTMIDGKIEYIRN
ncbi:amidohydrolase [Clostridium sp. MT-14]|uniref:Amidohydrolase n=1 Tax=Clostridium aromativorans TaxID=2836848 RepID=A0ABS8N5Y6_9CLOT|nr:amidohydrolase [Clostridium aromativorans]MCC9295223.1 amidohydrolase [Clostridium aromativorans]